MNTSDQNVFVLDNAFKRRWKMKYISSKLPVDHPYQSYYLPTTEIPWGHFVKIVNKKIADQLDKGIFGEDRQIGPYFITKEYLTKDKNDHDLEKAEFFAHKVLAYIWTDIAKNDERTLWFDPSIQTLDDLFSNVKNIKGILSTDLIAKLLEEND
jgi:hypothetical protein